MVGFVAVEELIDIQAVRRSLVLPAEQVKEHMPLDFSKYHNLTSNKCIWLFR